MKKILGLDLGTNSIGWALIEQDFDNKKGNILGMGSRIIPMNQDIISKFGSGQSHSNTAERTSARGARRLYQRDNLRRERLHRVLNILGFLPQHYANEIDFEFHKGQFFNHAEPKLPYAKNKIGKHEFIFKDSFEEMVGEFKKEQPELFYLKLNGTETKIPYDWTIYYLRNKALSNKISTQELAWILLNFNQKRGYYQLGEEEEQELDESKLKEFNVLKVSKVIDSGEVVKKTGEKLFDIYFDNGWKYDKQTTKPKDWETKTKEFIVTTTQSKNGEIKRSFKTVDSEQDWIAIKKKTEQKIESSGKTVGTYIYETLLSNPSLKIRGRLVRTIERKFYKQELKLILKKQIELEPNLFNKKLYEACINELYPNNEPHRKNLQKQDFLYLFINDIIFYQRPLKTKTHHISDCSLEYRIRRDTKEKIHVKCIAKSNPIFQEFRLWQFLSNLRVYEREREGVFDVDITNEILESDSEWVNLFDWLNNKEKVNQKQLLSYFKKKEERFKWNYVEEKEYPCNETRASFIARLNKVNVDTDFLSPEITQNLWHILYSVTDIEERKSALTKFNIKHNLTSEAKTLFEKYPLFKRDYGSFSEKATKKLLPLMRKGKYWNWDNIDQQTQLRIDKILTGEYDEKIQNRVREKAYNLANAKDFCGLPLWLASYIVYDKHSEVTDRKKWATSQNIADFLNPNLKGSFKQHSLRNPIVEQVLTETLRVVKDIWDQFGNGKEGYFDEIHIELGREIKNDKKTRERISKTQSENENTNLRIRSILNELLNDGIDVKPYSPSQQEILKIYEEGIYQNENKKDILEDIEKIRKNTSPSKSEIQRYKLWLEQGYISPYTGKTIKLTELFSHKYQIEHILPQSRYFDDSLNNKVICEAEVNELKDNKTAFEFIQTFGGSKVSLSHGNSVKLFSLDEYEQHIKSYFATHKIKREYLLMADIPESFINRQMNDSRYISKVVKSLLSKIVREENEIEVTSKHVVPVSGSITSQLKQDWGLNDIWNEIIAPRFKRMNELTHSNDFGELNPNTNKFLPKVPDSLLKGFSKKRIDHRHHALDALIIACVTRNHINYISSLNTNRENFSLVKSLRKVESIEFDQKQKDGSIVRKKRNFAKEYHKPWDTFTLDARNRLETLVVTFKQNTRVINKTKNKYWSYYDQKGILRIDNTGVPKKELTTQNKGENWAIRKSLHKAFTYAKVDLPFISTPKDKFITAIRTHLDTSFDEKRIEKITDRGIQKILINYLKTKGEPELAFSPDGIEELNINIKKYNDGKHHKPITKVRVFEIGSRFQVGQHGNKGSKYVEADKGTNLFFCIYQGINSKGEEVRQYYTVPLNEAIENLKQTGEPAPQKRIDKYGNEFTLLFTLSPNDLVYIPMQDDNNKHSLPIGENFSPEKTNRIYKFVSSSGSQGFFIPLYTSSLIRDKFEFSPLNKMEKSICNEMIKSICWKLKLDRIGNIKRIYY